MIDDVLGRDLAALSRDVRDGMPPLVVREREPRSVLLPLANVFAERIARAAAGAALLVLTGVLLGAALLPPGDGSIGDYTDTHPRHAALLQLNVIEVIALAIGAGRIAHALAHRIAAAAIARRMRAAADPLSIGRRLVARADGWALGLPIAGVSTLAIVVIVLMLAGGDDASGLGGDGTLGIYLATHFATWQVLVATQAALLREVAIAVPVTCVLAAAIARRRFAWPGHRAVPWLAALLLASCAWHVTTAAVAAGVVLAVTAGVLYRRRGELARIGASR